MEAIITGVSSIVTAAISWIGSYATVITEQPVLMTYVVCLPLVGLGVGLFKRLLSARG